MRIMIPGVSVFAFASIMLISLVHTISEQVNNKGITESISALYAKPVEADKHIVIIKPRILQKVLHRSYLVSFVSTHWRLPVSKASTIVKAAFKYGRQYKVPPLFILSEIATESSFQTKAYSDVSAVGIMQVYPKEHWKYVVQHGYTGSKYKQLFRIIPNIKFGTYILSKYYHTYGSINKAAAHYFGICSFDKTYVKRIDTNLNLLQQKI